MQAKSDAKTSNASTPVDELRLAAVYQQLRAAARRARRVNPQRTMNTTALVNEAWMKLNQSDQQFESELHYLKTAALAMRQILVDYARYRGAAKRARADEVLLVESRMADIACKNSEDWLALDQALNELNTLDMRAVEVVTLRFFAGLTIEKTAEVLGISSRSAARDWRRARAFLIERLSA